MVVMVKLMTRQAVESALFSLLETRSPECMCIVGTLINTYKKTLNNKNFVMLMNSRSEFQKSQLTWSRTLSTLLSMNGEGVCVPVFAKKTIF